MRKVTIGTFTTTPRQRELVAKVLETGRISYGPICEELEDTFAKLHDSRYAVVSASGTDSLRAALHAFKIKHRIPDGKGVLVPATTFVATFNIVTQLNMHPILVEVEPEFMCMDPVHTKRQIQRFGAHNIAAMIPVNLLGQAANLSDLRVIAGNNNILMMEDSCEAMFVNHRGYPVGSWGDIGCFSFYMAHLVTAGVGGIAVTDDPELYRLMRSLLNHGRDPSYISIDDDDGDSASLIAKRFLFHYDGYSSRMTELQAALALPQLEDHASMLFQRQEYANKLTDWLCRLEHPFDIILPYEREAGEHAYMMYPIMLGKSHDVTVKQELTEYLEANGIETREILPLINQPPVLGYVDPSDEFTVSQNIIDRGFYIGSHQDLTEEDAVHVYKTMLSFFSGEGHV